MTNRSISLSWAKNQLLYPAFLSFTSLFSDVGGKDGGAGGWNQVSAALWKIKKPAIGMIRSDARLGCAGLMISAFGLQSPLRGAFGV
ncbi:MAG: hypothetical protein V7746_13560 [Halioglobus sp.]